MNRLTYYALSFLISSVVYIILSISNSGDSLYFIAFVLSSLALVYSREELPKTKEAISKPSVHKYYKSRINIYGYSMATLMVILSLAFTLLTFYLRFKLGIAVAILWIVAIIATFYISKYTSTKITISSFKDYFRIKYSDQFTNREMQEIDKYIDSIENLNVKLYSEYTQKEALLDEDLREQIKELYTAYSTQTKLTSGDISAINDASKR